MYERHCVCLVPLPILDIIHLSNLDNYIISIFHNLGIPLTYRTLIVDLMRNLYIHNACIYIDSIYKSMTAGLFHISIVCNMYM